VVQKEPSVDDESSPLLLELQSFQIFISSLRRDKELQRGREGVREELVGSTERTCNFAREVQLLSFSFLTWQQAYNKMNSGCCSTRAKT